MNSEVFTLIAGGRAGEGIRKAGTAAANLFARMGRQAFQMDDYPSLIRGGHNFSVVSTATRPILSHYLKANLVVAFDQRSVDAHKDHLAEGGVMVYNSDSVKQGNGVGLALTTEAKKYANPGLIVGVSSAAALAAAIGMDKEGLVEFIKAEYGKGVEDNIRFGSWVYDAVLPKLEGRFPLERGDRKRALLTGNEAIALGAAAAGLDLLFAYPMTPASSILHFLAGHADELGLVAVHPENEIGVANMAIGAAFAGARTMIASSGGGFALMQEAFSLAGMTEAPLLCVLSSRPGPSTGVPTYTSQGDLRFALNQGHGEFPRIVASPGSVEEAFALAAELLELTWSFQTPAILLTEKHLSESRVTVEIDPKQARWAEREEPEGVASEPGKEGKGLKMDYKRYLDTTAGVSPLRFPPAQHLIKWNSYEHDELGITTEDPAKIVRMQDKRRRKGTSLVEHINSRPAVNVYGDKGKVIMTYGSTTMSVLEALRCGGIEATVVQPVYLEPLPSRELRKYADSDVTVVEQSSTGLFAELLRDKAGVTAGRVISRYDGRPFDPQELAEQLEEA